MGERLVCNQEVEGSIPFVSILNIHATTIYGDRVDQEINEDVGSVQSCALF